MKRTVLLLASITAGLMLAGLVTLAAPDEQALAAFPGTNGKIAFVRDPDGYRGKADPEIYTIWFDGNNLKRLTNNSKPDSAPSWSPDGKKIVFTHGPYLYTMNANGSNQKKIPNATGHNPAFSPSGRKIIYDAGDIYTIDVDGTHRTRITNYKPTDPYEDNPTFTEPVWSPVSNQIAFSWSVWIYVKPLSDLVNKKSLESESPSTPFWTFRPDWSPDGTLIAYQCYYDPCDESSPEPPSANYEIYKANANGTGTPTRITNDPAKDIDPAFSPGGGKIVYSSNHDGDFDLYIRDADGTGTPQRLTSNSARDTLPDWQPVR